MFYFFVRVSDCTQLHRPHVLPMATGGIVTLTKPSCPGYLGAALQGPNWRNVWCYPTVMSLIAEGKPHPCTQYLPLPSQSPFGLISRALSTLGRPRWRERCENHLQRCSNSCFTLTFWDKLLIRAALIFNSFFANLLSLQALRHLFAKLFACLLLQHSLLLQLWETKHPHSQRNFPKHAALVFPAAMQGLNLWLPVAKGLPAPPKPGLKCFQRGTEVPAHARTQWPLPALAVASQFVFVWLL